MPTKTPHITVITRRSDRRIGGRPGARLTLCGVAPTDRDILLRDYSKLNAETIALWRICEACIEQVGRSGR